MAEVLDENRPLEGVVASSATLEESYRRATTQKPIRERGLTQISRAGIPKRQLPNCQAGPTASSTPLRLVAQMPWGGHPLCGRPAGYLPPGTVGQWPPATLKWRTVFKGGDPITDQEERLGPRAGIPKRKRPNCQKRYSQTSVVCINALRRGPRTLASWRHWLMRVVAATAGTICLDGRIRQPFRVRRGQLYQVLRHRRFCLSAADRWARVVRMVVCCGIGVPSLGFADDSTVSSAVVFQVQIASFDTPFRKGKCCPIFALGVPGIVAEPADKQLVTEDQRSLAFVSQFVLVSGLVWNRHSDSSVPRTCAMYTGWCPLAKHVPPLDRSRVVCRVCKSTSYFLCCDFSFTCDPVSLATAARIPLLLPISRLHHAHYDAAIMQRQVPAVRWMGCKLCRKPFGSTGAVLGEVVVPVVQRQCPGRDGADNCGGSAVAVLFSPPVLGKGRLHARCRAVL